MGSWFARPFRSTGSRIAKPMPSWFGSVRLTNIRIAAKAWRRHCRVFALRALQACRIAAKYFSVLNRGGDFAIIP
jgi:hypothetical protein